MQANTSRRRRNWKTRESTASRKVASDFLGELTTLEKELKSELGPERAAEVDRLRRTLIDRGIQALLAP
jgi:hypothetical protein